RLARPIPAHRVAQHPGRDPSGLQPHRDILGKLVLRRIPAIPAPRNRHHMTSLALPPIPLPQAGGVRGISVYATSKPEPSPQTSSFPRTREPSRLSHVHRDFGPCVYLLASRRNGALY